MAKEVKPKVISFRLTQAQHGKMVTDIDKAPIVGVKSENQYARKIVRDFLAGKLVYKNPNDRLMDTDISAT